MSWRVWVLYTQDSGFNLYQHEGYSSPNRCSSICPIFSIYISCSPFGWRLLILSSGNRHRQNFLTPQTRKPSRSPPRPPSRRSQQRPIQPPRNLTRQHSRDIPNWHIAAQPQNSFPIHKNPLIIQRPQAESSRLLGQALEQETLHERDLRGFTESQEQ
jgi:hypothetical protein